MERFPGAQDLVSPLVVQAIQIAREVPRIYCVEREQVVVGGHHERKAKLLRQVRCFALVCVADDALPRAEEVATVDRHEGHVYLPSTEGLYQAIIDHGVARVVERDAVPLDYVP
jgi:hypothetical protein